MTGSGSRPRVCFVAPDVYPLFAGLRNVPAGGAGIQQWMLLQHLKGDLVLSAVSGDHGQRVTEWIDGLNFIMATGPPPGLASLPPGGGGLFPHLPLDLISTLEYNPMKWRRPLENALWRGMNAADADLYFQMTADWMTGAAAEYCREAGRPFIFATASDEDCTLETRDPAMKRLILRGMGSAAAVVAQTDEQSRMLRENFDLDPVVIPSIWPMDPAQAPSGEGDHVLWAGRIDGNKRPELVLEAARANPQIKFVMAGYPGDRDLYERIAAGASELKNLEFLGHVPFGSMATHFAGCRFLLNTSVHEGLPNTFLQAWSCSRPVLSCGVDPDGVIQGRGLGRVAESPGELPGMVAGMWKDGRTTMEQGANGRRYVREVHSIERVAPLYLKLFRECMG